jgi:hypothetical protein
MSKSGSSGKGVGMTRRTIDSSEKDGPKGFSE